MAIRDALIPELDQEMATTRSLLRAALAGASDEDLMMPWSLKNGEVTIFTLPRVMALRGFVLNHIIHHRGQLSVYLRLRDVPLPSIYGPTADTAM
jgi:uncharacterized damage-inducible protein DinB